MEDDREQIRRWLDTLYREHKVVSQLDAISKAQVFDLPADAMDVVEGLPPAATAALDCAINSTALSWGVGSHESLARTTESRSARAGPH